MVGPDSGVYHATGVALGSPNRGSKTSKSRTDSLLIVGVEVRIALLKHQTAESV